MAITDKRKESMYKYAKENLKRVPLDMQKSTYEEIKAHAEARSESVNGFIKRAISEAMERDKAAPAADKDESEVWSMSEREQAKQIIDQLPEYKISNLLLFLRGMQFDDEIEDDLYCERLVEDYLNDTSPDKHDTITLEELAKREGVELWSTP